MADHNKAKTYAGESALILGPKNLYLIMSSQHYVSDKDPGLHIDVIHDIGSKKMLKEWNFTMIYAQG